MEEPRETAFRNVAVSYAVMNPDLWGNLPRELLVLVLARMPLFQIASLRSHLSKEWTLNVEFTRACDDGNPNMAALLSYAGNANEFSVRIIDFSKFVWLYEYRFRLTSRGNAQSWFDSFGKESVWMPMASDGGLVCFVSNWTYMEANPLCVVVINPLTRVQHELPPLLHEYTIPPTFVHMKVDSQTKGYKVVVVVVKEGRHRRTVETYDSVSRQWSRGAPSWGQVFGIAHDWKFCYRHRNHFSSLVSTQSSCYLETGHLGSWGLSSFPSEGAYEVKRVLAGDRMFVMHSKGNQHDIEPRVCFITEFRFRKSAKVWVPVRTHGQCFREERNCTFDLLACEGVLVLRKRRFKRYLICSFLNFSTSEWHELPENSRNDQYVSLVCRVFWHAIPEGIV